MQIKAADDKQPLIDAMAGLLRRPDLPAQTRRQIEQELRAVRSGLKAEREVAYQIEFYFGTNPNAMTIHDLRIECDGRVAQIDHLIIDPLFEIWVCESKSYTSGVWINEHGEWSTNWRGRPQGIASPIEQNLRHVVVLGDVLAKGHVAFPKRLGMTVRPTIKSLVVIAKGTRISRPGGWAASRVEGLQTVIKADQLYATISRAIGQRNIADVFLTPGERETVEKLARELVALHAPARVDVAARFGLPPDPVAGRSSSVGVSGESSSRRSSPPSGVLQVVCESCREAVPDAVVSYCRTNAVRFRGLILCVTCQRRLRATHA